MLWGERYSLAFYVTCGAQGAQFSVPSTSHLSTLRDDAARRFGITSGAQQTCLTYPDGTPVTAGNYHAFRVNAVSSERAKTPGVYGYHLMLGGL